MLQVNILDKINTPIVICDKCSPHSPQALCEGTQKLAAIKLDLAPDTYERFIFSEPREKREARKSDALVSITPVCIMRVE